MRNFLKKFSKNSNTSTVPTVNKLNISILEQSPTVLLCDLENIEYVLGRYETELVRTANQNPHNKVVLYGYFFDILYWKYLEHLTCKIKNRRLPRSGYYPNYPWRSGSESLYKRDTRPYITDYAYEKMPKRYHGVFKKYNSEAYVLNTNAAPYKILIVKPENRPEMESLLLNMAEILDKKDGIRGICVEDDTTDATNATKEQIDNINQLRDICIKLNSITQPGFKHSFAHAGENHKKRHGAYDVYNEYRNEKAQKDRYLKIQEQIKAAKQKQLLKQQAAVSEYNTTRSIIIADAKKQIIK